MEQFLKDYGYIISVIIIPTGIWIGSIWYQNRGIKRKAKQDLFLKLISLRKSNSEWREWSTALNQIDVVFQDNKEVRIAWRAYFDSLHPKSQHFEKSNTFMLDLLSEMAKVLKYKDLKQTDIDTYYTPQNILDTKNADDLIRRHILRLLINTEHLGDPSQNNVFQKRIDEMWGDLGTPLQDYLSKLKQESQQGNDQNQT